MAALIGSRTRLFKDVLASSFRTNAVLKPYASYRPQDIKKFKEIPGPKSIPIGGKMLSYYLGSYTLENLPSLYGHYLNVYGPLVKEHMFYGRTLVHVFDPQDMDKIYRLDKTNHPYRLSHRALEEYRIKTGFKNGGLPSSNGETWAELRRLLGEDLLKKHHSEGFEIVTTDLVNKIYKLIAFQPNREVNLFPWLYYWAMDCLAVFSLGVSFSPFCDDTSYDDFDKFIECVRLTQRVVFYTENLPRFLTRNTRKQLEEAQDFLYYFLRQSIGFHYFVPVDFEDPMDENDYSLPGWVVMDGATICLKNSLANDLADKAVRPRDLRAFIIDMFQGGILSAAHVLAFALYYLATNPEEQRKVRDALIKKKAVKQDGKQGGFEPVCQEINNVIRETMRLNPPTIGTGRVLPESLILSGYTVPVGTMCILHHQIASKQPKHFNDPDEFIPDRYNRQLSREALVANSPFAMGKRSCPGQEVAINEIGIALRAILSSFEVSYKYAAVGMKSGLTNEPDKDIRMTFTPSPL